MIDAIDAVTTKDRGRAKYEARRRKLRAERRAAGVCYLCGGEIDAADRRANPGIELKRCWTCRTKLGENRRAWRRRNPAKVAAWVRTQYLRERDQRIADAAAAHKEHLANGVCPRCGAEDVLPGLKIGEACRQKRWAADQARQHIAGDGRALCGQAPLELATATSAHAVDTCRKCQKIWLARNPSLELVVEQRAA